MTSGRFEKFQLKTSCNYFPSKKFASGRWKVFIGNYFFPEKLWVEVEKVFTRELFIVAEVWIEDDELETNFSVWEVRKFESRIIFSWGKFVGNLLVTSGCRKVSPRDISPSGSWKSFSRIAIFSRESLNRRWRVEIETFHSRTSCNYFPLWKFACGVIPPPEVCEKMKSES